MLHNLLHASILMAIQQSAGGSGDPYYAKVSTLLHFEGTNGSTTFADKIGSIWTPAGSAQISTAQAKFGSSSGSFNGTNSYIATPDSAAFDFGANDFTIEGWINPASFSTNPTIVSNWYGVAASNCSWLFYLTTSGKLQLSYGVGSTNTGTPSTTGITANVWTHVAVCRKGTTVSYFINGVLDATTYTLTGSLNVGPAGTKIAVGAASVASSATQFYNGYIDDLRITNGVARYTSSFTPPSAPYPDGLPTSVMPGFVASLSPTAYWQMNDALASSTLTDTVAGETLTLGGTYALQSTGLIPGDSRPSVSFTSGYAQSAAKQKWSLGTTDASGMIVGKFTTTVLATYYGIRDSGASNILALNNCNRVSTGDISVEDWYWASGKANSPTTTYNGSVHAVGWKYVASTNTLSLFVDGYKAASVVVSAARPTGATMSVNLACNVPGTQPFVGNLSDLSLFSVALPDSAFMDFANIVGVDPYAANVKSRLHFDGLQGSTTFTDQIAGMTWTASGNAMIDNTQARYGVGSYTCAGATGGLTGTSLTLGSTFTVEYWVRLGASTPSGAFFSNTGVNQMNTIWDGSVFRISNASVWTNLVSSPTVGTWYHIAVSCNAGTAQCYVNGVLAATVSMPSMPAATPLIGTGFQGWIDEFRITVGTARYSAAFTPSAYAFNG